MRVLQINRLDVGDGAGNAARRLHTGLLDLGIESTMFVEEVRGKSGDPTVTRFEPSRALGSRFRRRLRRLQIARSLARYRAKRPSRYEIFSDDRAPSGSELPAQLPNADVIHVHAMYQFVDYHAFFTTVPRHTPVVRTLHDMNFFTGGCHGAGSCTNYTERCGACPKLGSRNVNDLSRQIWLRKWKALQSVPPNRLHVVASSRWLAHEARRSGLLRDVPISVIPFGVDTEVFRPRDRHFAREILGIPRDAEVILFVAEPISRPVKRFAMLAEAVNGLRRPGKRLLVSLGSGTASAEVRIPYLNVGRVGNERLLSLVYSAADLLAMPSLQESFGLVALEAMACGTPVVGSDVGGIPDMVRPGVTGRLFPAHDVDALRAAIEEMLEDQPARTAMAVQCRRIVLDEYSLALYARRHADLYRALLAAEAPSLAARPDPVEHTRVRAGA
jgi:glycosyltransferase involved in cell wall biosynthesis